jgi:hypothetical protein
VASLLLCWCALDDPHLAGQPLFYLKTLGDGSELVIWRCS